MAGLLNSLEDGGEDDERKIEKNSTAKRERERMVFLLVGVRNTMANLLSSLEDGGEDEKTIEKHSTERAFHSYCHEHENNQDLGFPKPR